MSNAKTIVPLLVSLKPQASAWRGITRGKARAATKALMVILSVLLLLPGLGFIPVTSAQVPRARAISNKPEPVGRSYYPTRQQMMVFEPVNVRRAAEQEALFPSPFDFPTELRSIHPPKGEPPAHGGVPIVLPASEAPAGKIGAPPPSATGPSQGPTTSFMGEFLTDGVIPADTMGAVGTTHIVTVSNDRMRIQDRNGVELVRITLNAFWSSIVLEGGAVPSTFDPKIYFDRFNNRFIFFSSANGSTLSSAVLVAVSATADPTGTWFRYGIDADPLATAAGGTWADYPSIGFNKNWIVAMYNDFGYGTSGLGYIKPIIYVIDKANAYTGPGSLTVSVFQDPITNCVSPFNTILGCGFTLDPAITEDNTTDTEYLVEDWDPTAAQLRLSKLTGTPALPVLTVGTQFPQSTNSWRFDAQRIQTTGGYVPQRQHNADLVSGTRIMANDSRIQNSVLRNGALWCTHTVMLPTTPTLAGVQVGGGGVNPADNHSGVQWWQIDPTIETGLSTPPLQRARIEDPTADNCHDGNNALVATPPCSGSVANQHGTFFAFPTISVNQNNEALIGFSQFSAFTYPSAAYAFRASSDPVNTTRDPVVFRPGQGNYNLGAGTGGTAQRQNRWGDTSQTHTDPINDTDFWTVQEYSGTARTTVFAGPLGVWETWWALVKPGTAAPSKTGNLIISEFRLRGPQGVRDEFVELYNPGASAIIVNTTDNSDGWALASNNGVTTTTLAVIPNGTVIPAGGHFLFANNPDNGGLVSTIGPGAVYSLNLHPATQVRGADSDVGFQIDIPDNNGVAIFKTATAANFNAATRMDSAGFSSLPAGLFKEGAGIPAISVSTPAGQYTFYRDLANGVPQDTNANENDFRFVDPVLESFGVTPSLGSAGPENLDSPLQHNSTITTTVPFPCVSSTVAPNRLRDLTPVTNGANGTLDIRRTFTNSSAVPVTRLRFRVVDVTTTPVGAGIADVRLLDGVLVSVLSGSNPCGTGTMKFGGTTVETPPIQANGGAFNTTATAGTITLATPLPPGASVNLHFLLGVQVTGFFRFFVNIEALP